MIVKEDLPCMRRERTDLGEERTLWRRAKAGGQEDGDGKLSGSPLLAWVTV